MAVVGLQSGSPTYTCGFTWCAYYPYLTLHCHIQTTHSLAIIIKKHETFRYFIGYHLWDIVSSITFPCLFLRETSVHTRYTVVSLVPRPSPSFSSLAGQLTVLQATRSLTTSDGKLGEGLGTRLHHGINQHTLRFNVHCWSAIIYVIIFNYIILYYIILYYIIIIIIIYRAK